MSNNQPIPPVEEANKIAEQNNNTNQIPPGANQEQPVQTQVQAQPTTPSDQQPTPAPSDPQPPAGNTFSQEQIQDPDTSGTIQGLMLQIIALQHNDLLQKKALLSRAGLLK